MTRDLLYLLLGAVLTGAIGIVTGIILTRYQARRTEELTRRLRRAERQEQALLILGPKLPTRWEVEFVRGAIEYRSESSIAQGWSTIDNRLRDTEEAWRKELSFRIQSPEIRAGVENLLSVRDWFGRRVRSGKDEYGNEFPGGVDDIDRFGRAFGQFAARSDGLHDLIEAQLRA